jgi:vitamin B12 transporter
LIVILNKRPAYGLSYVIKLLALLCMFAPLAAYSQDTVALQSVEVTAKKNNLAQIGKKTEAIDSTLKAQFKFNSVGDALSFNTPVFIKSYGPGALSTTAFRGGNASQTAVLWNGFNLQNAMLGQADLALMPAVLFENIDVEYGGSTSLWGSGAVGGSIHLDNKTPFGKGLITATNLGAGSFGMLNGSTSILVSRQKFISSTKLYITDVQNNFNYRDTTDKLHPIKQQKHAAYNFKGLMQEFKFMLNPRQILSVNAWLNTNYRQLPAVNEAESKASQQDDAVRITANWSYYKTNFRSVARAALFYDKINYTDSIASLFSKSKVRTVMAESENYFNWHTHNQFNVGVNVTSSSAVTDNYESAKTLSRASVLAGNKFSLLHDKLVAYVAARAEYFSVGALPVTGNVSLEYKLMKNISVLANVAKVYRQPTLNELYWIPGGNINLKPEQGYTYEGTVNYKKQLRHISVFVSGAAYSRQIHNWILWIPGANGNPSPINIQQVWSRGLESTWKINYRKNKLQLGAALITGYVLSTTQASSQENNNTVNKQLIYTPRYTVNANISAGYGNVNLVLFHQYIGYRFTTSDNSEWLNPYSVSSLRVNYTLDIKKMKLIFYAAGNNLFNTNYTVLAGRVMPLRNYEFGITIQTKNNLKQKQLQN